MPLLTINETRNRLTAFSKEWVNAKSEKSLAAVFWLRFYECFGIRAESATIYEKAVKKISGAPGYIDSFIPGVLIVEHKSQGKNLDSAFIQASEYFIALKEADRPRYIITSDFARIRLYDLLLDVQHESALADLAKNADWFKFLSHDDAPDIVEESPVNRAAAYAVSKLHEALLRTNFTGRPLEVFMTRLLFCLFADKTGIFGENGMFRRMVEGTREDGKDLGGSIRELFSVLDQPQDKRPSTLDEAIGAFSYINGTLFSEKLDFPAFDTSLREALLHCASLDWSDISPAIFGAMFQGILEEHATVGKASKTRSVRRELGAHYTSERNILRALNPLCFNDLNSELKSAKGSKPKLTLLYDKLPTLTFFDPACGCGNFLVIAYRQLRRIENEVIRALFDFEKKSMGLLDVKTLCRVRVSQFYGIEIDPAAGHIARVAMWITDHQENLESARQFGNTRPTVPLLDSATISIENALRAEWQDVLPPNACSYLVGNPPFIGKQNQTAEQKADMLHVCKGIKNAGLLDYVAGWYVKAMHYIAGNSNIDVSFVSTNSITQGEQVAVLWKPLLDAGVHIRFAHRTFAWKNEGKGNAAVHCVIVGFGLRQPKRYELFEYGADLKADVPPSYPSRINPYLVDAQDTLLPNRTNPLEAVPPMVYGSKPTDGQNLLLEDDEKTELLKIEPGAHKWIRPFLGADEFLYNEKRWCLWLDGITPSELKALPEVRKRVQAVKNMRLSSTKVPTQVMADTPWLFAEDRQPKNGSYLLVPLHTSETRRFVPIGFNDSTTICGNANSLVPGAEVLHFGILSSTMHNAWTRSVCGRLESRYRYSNTIVYNNFIWPVLNPAQAQAITAAAQKVLDARAMYAEANLADLYDQLAMPQALRKAHKILDKLVDSAYGYIGKNDDASRASFMFEAYLKATSSQPKTTCTASFA